MPSLHERQLAAIAEVREVSLRLAVDVWLRGGWGSDFCLGRVTREHPEVSWFAWSGHAAAIIAALEANDWVCSDPDRSGSERTMVRSGVRMSFQVMSPGDVHQTARLVRDARVGRINGQACLAVAASAELVN